MRTTRQVASRRTAIVATYNDLPPPFSMTLAFLVVFDWIVVRLHSWPLQRPLLFMAALVAGLLVAACLVLRIPLGDALIFLVCWHSMTASFFAYEHLSATAHARY